MAIDNALLARGTRGGEDVGGAGIGSDVGGGLFGNILEVAKASTRGERGEPVAGTGVGLIDLFTLGARTEAGEDIRQAEAKREAAINTERGANLLLQNLDQVTNLQQANILRQGLSDPGTRAETLERIGVTRGEPAREMALNAGQLAIDNAISAEARAKSAEQRAVDNQEFEENLRPAKVFAMNQETALRSFQLEAAARTAGITPLVPEQIAIINPFTNAPTNAEISGETYSKQQNAVDSYTRSLANINELSELIRTFGSEMTGEQSTIMANKRNSIIFQTVQARGGGAPQEAELELAAEGLPSPTGFGANLRGFANIAAGPAFDVARAQQINAMIAGYADYNLEVSRAVKDMLKINPALNVNMDLLNPEIWTNENERQYYQQNSGTAYVTGETQ